jgi:hypothetical protein
VHPRAAVQPRPACPCPPPPKHSRGGHDCDCQTGGRARPWLRGCSSRGEGHFDRCPRRRFFAHALVVARPHHPPTCETMTPASSETSPRARATPAGATASGGARAGRTGGSAAATTTGSGRTKRPGRRPRCGAGRPRRGLLSAGPAAPARWTAGPRSPPTPSLLPRGWLLWGAGPSHFLPRALCRLPPAAPPAPNPPHLLRPLHLRCLLLGCAYRAWARPPPPVRPLGPACPRGAGRRRRSHSLHVAQDRARPGAEPRRPGRRRGRHPWRVRGVPT